MGSSQVSLYTIVDGLDQAGDIAICSETIHNGLITMVS